MVERIIVGPLATNAYIYSQWKKECILIDPGGDPDIIISHMAMKNLKPVGIVCTHGHLDHIAAIPEILKHYRKTDKNIPVAIHSDDGSFLGDSGYYRHKKNFQFLDEELILYYETALVSLRDADILLTENDCVFGSNLHVIHTPGHTQGSISLYDDQSSILFSGDTLFFEGIGRTDLEGGNHKLLMDSIKNRLLILPDDVRVFPGHGPFSMIEREKNHNPFFLDKHA